MSTRDDAANRAALPDVTARFSGADPIGSQGKSAEKKEQDQVMLH